MNQNLRQANSLGEFLKLEFDERNTNNPSYSMRAFARDLGLSKSHLSDVMNGHSGFSRTLTLSVSAKLKYAKSETEYLIALIEKDFGRTAFQRKMGGEKFEQLQGRRPHLEISTERFKVVSDWYHFAILEMTVLQDFDSDATEIAKRLGIEPSTVESAIERLITLGLAEIVDGKLRTSDVVSVGDDAPSEAIRTFHRQILKKSISAIETQTMDERLLSTHMNAVRRSDLPRARKRILEFAQKFNEEFGVTGGSDSLYVLSMQFFNLLKNHSKEISP